MGWARGGLDSIRGGTEEEREFRRFGGRERSRLGGRQGRAGADTASEVGSRDGEREEMMSRLVLCGSTQEESRTGKFDHANWV